MPVTAPRCVTPVTVGDGPSMKVKNKWRVIHRDGVWRIYDNDVWHDSCDTLIEAHTYATQLAVADTLFEPGGLTLLKVLQRRIT
jgi:hypothetical protein